MHDFWIAVVFLVVLVAPCVVALRALEDNTHPRVRVRVRRSSWRWL
jgi:hypothetical protein